MCSIEKSYYTWWIYPFGKEAKTALDTTSKFMKLSQEEIIVKYPYQKNTEELDLILYTIRWAGL